MKKRILALLLTVIMVFSLGATMAFADDYDFANTVIDTTKKGSIELWKYDLTSAKADGKWDDEKGQTPSGVMLTQDDMTTLQPYAIKGVIYSYLKVANLVTYSEKENNVQKVIALYEFEDAKSAALLTALGLTNNDAYPVVAAEGENGFTPRTGCHYFLSDTLVNALKAKLTENSTTVKNALETYILADNAKADMPETDAAGHSKVENLDLGLYLVVETAIPEDVVSTTDPFLVALPMTSVNGDNATDGGQRWIYDVKIFPKNLTGRPEMEKTVREAQTDTGKNNGSEAISDGYAHTATASAGDKVEYQIVSRLPVITSYQTRLTEWKFVDTLSKGIEYNGFEEANTAGLLNGHFNANDVVIELFIDANCTQKVATWREDDTTPKFTVTYAQLGTDKQNGSTMTIVPTEDGYLEINRDGTYEGRPMLEKGYSQLYYRITYSATLNQNADLVLGDTGNPNEVVLTWKRTNTEYFDTLHDDAIVYSYSVEVTKQFSDGSTDKFRSVKFKMYNTTDNYFVKAHESEEGSGIWYVDGHVDEANATMLIPSASTGKLVIYGLEDDTYNLREMETASGYTLLKDPVVIVISAPETTNEQTHKAQRVMSATVDGDARPGDDAMAAGTVALTVVNQKGFDLPKTGGEGTMWYAIGGICGLAIVTLIVVFLSKKRKKDEEDA